MKHFYIPVLCAILGLFSAKTAVLATETTLVIRHKMNGAPITMNAAVPLNGGTEFFAPRFLKYYVSKISFVRRAGGDVAAENVYLLVDALGTERYPLGNFDVADMDSLVFHVGVNRERNHEDPTIYPPGHPLGLHNPTMHWGWTAGYRFIAIEGMAGPDAGSVIADVQLHSVGNDLYRRVSVPVRPRLVDGTYEIDITAEYTELLHTLDVSLGLIFHGFGEETIVLSDNMATRVFRATNPTSVVHQDAPQTPWVTPSADGTTATIGGVNGKVQIFNLVGTLCHELPISGTTTFATTALPAGTYCVVSEVSGALRYVGALTIVR